MTGIPRQLATTRLHQQTNKTPDWVPLVLRQVGRSSGPANWNCEGAVQGDDFERDKGKAGADEQNVAAPERQPSQAHSAEGRCRQCGGPIRGRRRNGFCGDACRMRVYRQQLAEERRALIEHLKQVVNDVERELLGEAEP